MAKSPSRGSAKSSKAATGKRLERKHHLSGTMLGTIALGVLSIIASFGLGIRSAGEIKTLEHSEAAAGAANLVQRPRGDVNGNGTLEIRDALLMHERVMGLVEATRQETLDGDMNGDFALTNQDLRALLHALADR